jgi:Domain of unknown function (DUF4403)
MTVLLSQERLLAQLSEQVPNTVAHAKNQSIGAAGRVTFTIRRNDFQLETADDSINLTTHLNGDIDVCKPIGPFCAHYGSCKPTWNVKVSLATNFAEDSELRARTKVELDKGCVLKPVGYDATDELERITRDEARKVRDRINGELAQINRRIERTLKRWSKPQRWDGDCIQWHAERARYTAPHSADGKLGTAIELEGQLAPSCETDATSDAEDTSALPKFEAAKELSPEIDLVLETAWPLEAVQEAAKATHGGLELAISGPPGGATADAENRLWLRQAGGACSGWLQVVPRIAQGQLRFDAVGEGKLDDRTAKLAVPLPKAHNDWVAHTSDLKQQLNDAKADAREQNLDADFDVKPEQGVRVGPEGLHLGVYIRGTARLTSH